MRSLARFAAVGSCLFASPVLFAQDGSNAYAAGSQESQNQKWDQAIQDFNEAIRQNPTYAEAYSGRGLAKWNKHDINGALADLSKSISIEPKYGVLDMRGSIRFHAKQDNAGAMADFDQELSLFPSDIKAHYDRGNVKQYEGDIQGAIQDYNSCLFFDKDLGFQWRGYAETALYLTGTKEAGASAIRDLEKSIEIDPTDDYPHFFLWVVQASDPAKLDAANRDLSEYMLTRPGNPNDIENDIGNYLDGNLSEDDFIKKVGVDPKQRFSPRAQALFFVGIKHLYTGDLIGAATFFQRSVKQSGPHGMTTDAAQYWLKHAPAQSPTPQEGAQTQ